jgi:PKD domain
MNKYNFIAILLLAVLLPYFLTAQTGCPGCVVQVPAGLGPDTVYLPALPPGQKGRPYNRDIGFRLPKTTTPVNRIDGVTPPGLPISRIEILSVENLPPGLSWQANQLIFEPATRTDGCIKLCGTPLQSDSFRLNIRLRATVLILNQETSFTTGLYIAPETSSNAAFSLTNPSGCGSTTVQFVNRNPSNGRTGFSYQWNFGDGTVSVSETPPAKTYNRPGIYRVSYQARVDTARPVLQSVRILAADCSDLFNAPDLYVLVKDPSQKVIFDSRPAVDNTALPHTFNINRPIGAGNYTLELFDDDSGLGFADDACGVLSFNNRSRDTLTAGKMRLVMTTFQPITTINAVDTVRVFPNAVRPVITAPASACTGDTIRLTSSYTAGNQWFRGGQSVGGATASTLRTNQPGSYTVRASDANGCIALSDSVRVRFNALPTTPFFEADATARISLLNPSALPERHTLQWFLNGQPIDERGTSICARSSGTYTAQVTDLNTGCRNTFRLAVARNESNACTVSTSELATGTLRFYPNPATDEVMLLFGETLPAAARLRVWDLTGRLIETYELPNARQTGQVRLDCSQWPEGWLVLEVVSEKTRWLGRLVKKLF